MKSQELSDKELLLLWKSVEKQAKALTWKYAKKSPLEFDDLIDVTYLAFMKAVKTYDGRASFNSWFYIITRGFLRKAIEKDFQWRERVEKQIEESNESESSYVVESMLFWERVDELEESAKRLIQLIINPSKQVLNGMKKPSTTQLRASAIRQMKREGFPTSTCYYAMKRIKKFLEGKI